MTDEEALAEAKLIEDQLAENRSEARRCWKTSDQAYLDEVALWERALALQDKLGPGLKPGKLVRFLVGTHQFGYHFIIEVSEPRTQLSKVLNLGQAKRSRQVNSKNTVPVEMALLAAERFDIVRSLPDFRQEIRIYVTEYQIGRKEYLRIKKREERERKRQRAK